MNGDTIKFVSRDRLSTPIHRAALRDDRLSWGARGLFAFLWDLPDGWQLCSRHLAQMGPEKKDAVLARLKELVQVRAIERVRRRSENGLLCGSTWLIYSPNIWAQEAPLSPKKNRPPADKEVQCSTDGWISRPSDYPVIGIPGHRKNRP